MAMSDPDTLKSILSAVADAVGDYVGYQIDAGAQCVQIFDSWGGQLPPHMWEVWSKPYIQQVVDKVRLTHPGVPLTLYANGSGGLLERMATTGVDCIGLDWTIDMADGRTRVGDLAVQGNVDPAVLFAAPEAVEQAVNDVCAKAGPTGHILNLGHGVLVGTPEENVKVFFDAAKKIKYDA
jgi:uroporphyrinogen decarboxylase